jgi:hypothetical protein
MILGGNLAGAHCFILCIVKKWWNNYWGFCSSGQVIWHIPTCRINVAPLYSRCGSSWNVWLAIFRRWKRCVRRIYIQEPRTYHTFKMTFL